MNKVLMVASLVSSFFASSQIMADPVKADRVGDCPATLDYTLRELNSDRQVNLCEVYKDKVVMLVNTASKCAYTDQYEGLEAMYQQYKDQGLVILGFPSNDFGGQEPGTEKQVQEFCRLTYSVKFPMFEKTHAAKRNASPIYKTLGDMAGEYPRWNFHKYVLNRNGDLIGSFPSSTKPDDKDLVGLIKANLSEQPMGGSIHAFELKLTDHELIELLLHRSHKEMESSFSGSDS